MNASTKNAQLHLQSSPPVVEEEVFDPAKRSRYAHDLNRTLVLRKYVEELPGWEHAVVRASEGRGSKNPTALSLGDWKLSPVLKNITNGTVNSLWYESIELRRERIAEAHALTFRWVLEPAKADDVPWDNFTEWLSSRPSSSEIYWITGKAGSGKSTLMKYLFGEERLMQYLETWSNPKPLVTAAYFFWDSGTDLQKSQEGLLRSLLYQIVRQRQQQNKSPLPIDWHRFCLTREPDGSWEWPGFIRAFEILANEDDFNYAFFIDGLDEFNGSHPELIAFIKKISSYNNVKVCVASRQWIAFEDVFARGPSLMLHNLTYSDIKSYVAAKMRSHRAFEELEQYNMQYSRSLVTSITEKAQGVFLWVVLVVLSLLQGLEEGDTWEELENRLNSTPAELMPLFGKMLDVDGENPISPRAAHYFKLVQAVGVPPTLLTASLADEGEDYIYRRTEPFNFSRAELSYRSTTIRRRIYTQCKGLLEVAPVDLGPCRGSGLFAERNILRYSEASQVSKASKKSSSNDGTNNQDDPIPDDEYIYASARVEYLHRTVKDFLLSRDVRPLIETSPDFRGNIHLCLCQSFLSQLKALDSRIIDYGDVEEEVMNLASGTIHHATAAWEANVQSSLAFLDELDKTVALIPQFQFRTSARSTKPSHWAIKVPGGCATDDFLSLTVRCQTLPYIQARLTKNPTKLSELLLTAVSSYSVFEKYRYRSNCSRSLPSIELIRILLQAGANQDAVIGASSSARVRVKAQMGGTNGPSAIFSEINALFIEFDAKRREEWTIKPINLRNFKFSRR